MTSCFSRSKVRGAEQRPPMLRSRSKGSPVSPVHQLAATAPPPVPAPPLPDPRLKNATAAMQKLNDRETQHLAVDELHRLACVRAPLVARLELFVVKHAGGSRSCL